MSKSWSLQYINTKSIDMKTIIYCPSCGKDSGYTQEGLMHYVISFDLKCKNCRYVIVQANPYVWRES